jgi:hypothetical protein
LQFATAQAGKPSDRTAGAVLGSHCTSHPRLPPTVATRAEFKSSSSQPLQHFEIASHGVGIAPPAGQLAHANHENHAKLKVNARPSLTKFRPGEDTENKMNSGKCPHCSAEIDAVRAEKIEIITDSLRFHGVSYLCTRCQGVLSVSIDPVALVALTKATLTGAEPR